MVRSERLSPIKKLASNKEKAAAQALAVALETQRIENQKLSQLKEYKADYLGQMDVHIRKGMNAVTLHCYQSFLEKIDGAIEQQEQVLIQCRQKLLQVKSQWQDDRSKAQAISQVMEKMQATEQKIANKKEAAQIDEISTQAFLRRHNST